MILSCGEALIDMLPRTTPNGEIAFAPYAGGALFNTAIALARLGNDTGFVSGLSSDLFGDQLRETLQESQVATKYSVTSDRPTTLAFVRLIDGQARYTFYDENTALRLLEPADVPQIPDEVTALVFGCISLVGVPCATFFEAMMERHSDEKVIMIDPNIRAGFITDEANYRARLDRMTAKSDIVKLSDEDLHWMAGDGDQVELAQKFLNAGIKLVCITEGAKGARGITRDFDVFVPATKVDVVDTVGAGDTVNAGILTSLRQNGCLNKDALNNLSKQTVTDALSLGVRAAAITVSRAGANPPWASEL